MKTAWLKLVFGAILLGISAEIRAEILPTDTILTENEINVESDVKTENADTLKKLEVLKEKKKIFYGFGAHLDFATPIITTLTDRAMFSAEGAVNVNLLYRYYPVFEVGFGSANKTTGGEIYKVNAPFYRVGADFSLLKTKDKDGNFKIVESYPYIGLRYGFSLMNYALTGVRIQDDYWSENQTVDFPSKPVFVGWGELVAGVRVNAYKGLTMGWAMRLSFLSHGVAEGVRSQLWYVPGFGKNNPLNFTFNYSIGYFFKYDK